MIINGETVATTGQDGTFTIPSLAAGKYTATLSYQYGYDRNITIEVKDGNVNLGSYGMVVCNFKKDAAINGTDYNTYKKSTGKSKGSASYNEACDFNHDGAVNDTDYNIYKAFTDRKSTRLNSSHNRESRMPSSA